MPACCTDFFGFLRGAGRSKRVAGCNRAVKQGSRTTDPVVNLPLKRDGTLPTERFQKTGDSSLLDLFLQQHRLGTTQ